MAARNRMFPALRFRIHHAAIVDTSGWSVNDARSSSLPQDEVELSDSHRRSGPHAEARVEPPMMGFAPLNPACMRWSGC
jgi:hypothetical protein